MNTTQLCKHCDGQGYIEIRDCSAEIQRQENCSFCGGTGEIETINLTEIVQNVQNLVQGETAVLALAENHGVTVYYAASTGKYADKIVGLRGDAASSGLCGTAFQDTCPVLVTQTLGDLRVRQDYVQSWGINTALAVSLRFQGQLLGALLVFNSLDGQPFNEESSRNLTDYANNITPVIAEYLLNFAKI
jgi:GAF domain-containing protein